MSSQNPRTEADRSPYGYVPMQWVCILFIALFGVSTVVHAAQATKYRMWWLLPTAVLAGIGEVVGWSGRYWSTRDMEADGFLMQITSTIIALTPLIAANFIILAQVITIVSPEFSRLAPRLFSRIFLTCDIVALTVQAVGGAMASVADDREGTARGGKIMLGGIVFQLVAITAYAAFGSEFFARVILGKPIRARPVHDVELDPATRDGLHNASAVELSSTYSKGNADPDFNNKIKLTVVGLAFSTLVIYIRSIYRTIELSDGWNGRIIQTQLYFNVLDGMMIVLAMYTLNILHPGHLLRR